MRLIPAFIWTWFKTNVLLGAVLVLLICIILMMVTRKMYTMIYDQQQGALAINRILSADDKFTKWLDATTHGCRNHPVCDTRLPGSINICCYLRHGLHACERHDTKDPLKTPISCITLRKEILQRYHDQYGRYDREPPSFPLWLTSQLNVLHPESIQAALADISKQSAGSARGRLPHI